jgi:hypothetical protein
VRESRAGRVDVVAIDGSKVAANASREANRDYERLAREVIEESRQSDAEEDERFGDLRGDELPPELATSAGRQQWFKGARRWLDDQRAEQATPMPRDRAKRVREAKRRMGEQCYVAADGGTSLTSIALSEITDAELGRDGYAPALGVRRRACNPSELRRQWMKSLRSQVVTDPAAASLGELSSRCPTCTCHTRACERCATYP